MVDRGRGDRQHGEAGQERQQRDQVEHRSDPELPAGEPGEDGSGDVAGPVAGGVAGEAGRQPLADDQAHRDRRHGGREHGTQHRHDDVRRQHHRHGGRLGDRHRAGGECCHPADQECPLVPGRVDQGADGRVQRDPEQPADGQHEADPRLVPLPGPDQEHADIGPEPAAHVGQEEVGEVEAAVEGHVAIARSGHCSSRAVALGFPCEAETLQATRH